MARGEVNYDAIQLNPIEFAVLVALNVSWKVIKVYTK